MMMMSDLKKQTGNTISNNGDHIDSYEKTKNM